MLRISEMADEASVTFCLAGRLSGEWAQVLEQCWREAALADPSIAVHVDLTEVTFVDDAGKRLLAAMAGQGGELIAADVLMQALVDQIMQEISSHKDGSPPSPE
jgi:anti-anti-sigma regulatory factor